MNTLFVLSAPEEPTSPRRPKDNTHNTNAVASAIPTLYAYPRFVRRTALGRTANESSSCLGGSVRPVARAGAPCKKCSGAPKCRVEILDIRNLVTRPEQNGNTTNGMATPRAILGPHDSFVQATAVRKIPIPETAHIAHMDMRKFVEAFLTFQPQLPQK